MLALLETSDHVSKQPELGMGRLTGLEEISERQK